MKLSLNSVIYGNPTNNVKSLLSKKCLVDDLFAELKDFPFPANESDTTKQELNELIENINDISLEENKKFLNRYYFYDRNLFQAIKNSFQTDVIDVEKLIEDINQDVNGLIMRLKYHYQRPRPYQLANYYRLKLFPFESRTAHSPSYPSGHTIQAFLILSVIGNKVPDFYERAKQMIDDVAYGRTYMGLHYATDNDFAFQVGQAILKNQKFTEKHGI